LLVAGCRLQTMQGNYPNVKGLNMFDFSYTLSLAREKSHKGTKKN